MKDIVLATLGSTHFTQKSGDICLLANSPLTRLPGLRNFFYWNDRQSCSLFLWATLT